MGTVPCFLIHDTGAKLGARFDRMAEVSNIELLVVPCHIPPPAP